MSEILANIDWMEVITVLWSVVLLPLLTYVGTQLNEWFKAKKIDKYTDILYIEVVNAVKDVQETIVKDIKNTEEWTNDKKTEVRELAKTKALQALGSTAKKVLKEANDDFETYLDNLIGTALFDIKNK